MVMKESRRREAELTILLGNIRSTTLVQVLKYPRARPHRISRKQHSGGQPGKRKADV